METNTAGRIRVLRMIARTNIGGPAIQTLTLTRRLEPLGYDTVLLHGRLAPGEGSMDHLAEQLGLRPVTVPGLRRSLGVHDALALWHTIRWMRRLRPDIVHTHTAKAGALGRLAALLTPGHRPAALVHTFHGHVFEGEFSPPASRVFAFLERCLGRLTTRILAVSPEVRTDLIARGIAAPERIEVLRLGFDLAPFDRPELERRRIGRAERERLGIPTDARVVSVIARVVKIKRIDRFLEMAAALPSDTWFVIAGDGAARPELERSEAARALAPRLVWTGFVRDVPAITFASDVLALSSDNEGTPVCLIEAQAASVPVVCTRVGGVETVVVDGVTGFVVEPDPKALAAAVRRLLDDEPLRAAFGAAGRERSLAAFSIERLVADVDDLYRRLLEPDDPTARSPVRTPIPS